MALPAETYAPTSAPLRVIYRDLDLLVLDKPTGLLTVPGKGSHLADCLEARARAAWPEARIVHRLDRDTSGVIVLAMTAAAQRHLGLQFERRKVTKTYDALVAGEIAGEGGEIDLPLACDWPNRPLQQVDHVNGRKAVTRWRVTGRDEAVTRVRLEPLTGRSHQLRVHMRELGHPILGDPLYGDGSRALRLMLHATSLGLHHPADGTRVLFEAPAPF